MAINLRDDRLHPGDKDTRVAICKSRQGRVSCDRGAPLRGMQRPTQRSTYAPYALKNTSTPDSTASSISPGLKLSTTPNKSRL